MESADVAEVLERSLRQTSLPPDSEGFDNEAVAVDRIVLRVAIDEIKRLRSLCGCADVGTSFRDMTKDLPRAERSNALLAARQKLSKALPGQEVKLTAEEWTAIRHELNG